MSRSAAELLGVMHAAASAIGDALAGLADWGLAGTIDGQYVHDLAADRAGLAVLHAAGLSVVSEESGSTGSGLVVVIDPVDGSTNASRGIPWWNTSLSAVDDDGLLASLVVDHLHGTRDWATRGGGAFRNDVAISPTACGAVAESIVGLNGYPPVHLGWKQYRALGAAASDLCAVASGVLDAYVDCTTAGLAPWDYLGGLLICQEAGAVVATVDGAPLVTVDPSERRVLVAAATPELRDELLVARRTFA